jgi:hypothetical protein
MPTTKTAPLDVREQIRTALAHHPMRAVAQALGLAPATVASLAMPDDIRRVQAGTIALAEKNAGALSVLMTEGSPAR